MTALRFVARQIATALLGALFVGTFTISVWLETAIPLLAVVVAVVTFTCWLIGRIILLVLDMLR